MNHDISLFLLALVICSVCCHNTDIIFTPLNSTIVDSVKYPIDECLGLSPANQFYFPTLYTFDTGYYDYCNAASFPKLFDLATFNVSKLETFSCVEILCEPERRWDLNNATQQTTLAVLLNYCLYCNNSHSDEFRMSMANSTCTGMSIGSVSSEEFSSKMIWLSDRHCNGRSGNSDHLAIVDPLFFKSDYFSWRFLAYIKGQPNTTTDISNTMAKKSVTMSSLLTFYFKELLSKTNLETIEAPLDLPFMCWCNYKQSIDRQSFGFQCGDFYQSYQTPFVYRFSTIFFFLYWGVLCILLLVFIVIPRTKERIHSFKTRPDVTLQNSQAKKVLTFIPHYFDIVVQAPLFFTISCAFGFIETLFRFIFNFSSAISFYRAYFPGIFRGLCVVFMFIGYSSLVISWSHVIDQSKKKERNKVPKLSRFNMAILTILYICTISSLVIAVIVFLATSNYSYAWIVLAIACLFYIITFGIGFAFYGFKILLTLGSTEKKSFTEYKFTKFMLLVQGFFLFGWIICFLVCISYMLGFDSMTVFWGVTRNIFLDVAISAVIIISTYITFNEEAFKLMYGELAFERLQWFFCCCGLRRASTESTSHSVNPEEEQKTNF